MGAQRVLATRLRLGSVWHLGEFFQDRSADYMRVIDEFMQPILEDAITKRRASQEDGKEVTDEDHGTLLDHLVRLTDGKGHCDVMPTLYWRLSDAPLPSQTQFCYTMRH